MVFIEELGFGIITGMYVCSMYARGSTQQQSPWMEGRGLWPGSAMGMAAIQSPSSQPCDYKLLITHKPCTMIGFTLGTWRQQRSHVGGSGISLDHIYNSTWGFQRVLTKLLLFDFGYRVGTGNFY